MTRWLPVLTAIAGLILGIAAGFVAFSNAETELPVAHVDRGDAPVSDPPTAQGDGANPAARQPPAGAPAKDAAPATDLAAWLAALGVKVEPEGEGKISGAVKLMSGLALAGARIHATPHLEPPAVTDGQAPEAAFEGWVRHRARQMALERTVLTDSAGRYELSGLQPGLAYMLSAELRGYDIQRAGGGSTTYFSPGSEVHFVAKAAERVTVELRLPDGTIPNRGRVSISEDVDKPPGVGFWHWNPAATSRAFEPGAWRLEFRAGDDDEYGAESQSLRIVAGEAPPVIRVQLSAQPAIIGRVNPPPGITESRLVVHLLKQVDGKYEEVTSGETDVPAMRRQQGLRATLHAFQGWSFKFLALTPGDYRLDLLFSEKLLTTLDVKVGDRIARVEITPPQFDIRDFIVAQVTGPEGRITDGLSFSLVVASENSRRSTSAGVVHQGDGVYWILRDDSRFKDASEGWFEVQVRSRQFGSRTARYERSDTHVLEFWFVEPAVLTVTIVGFDDHKQKVQLQVSIDRPGAEGPSSMDFLRSGRGSAALTAKRQFGPLEPGDYEIWLAVRDEGAFDALVLERKVVKLVSGENLAELTPPELYAFTIEIPEEYQGKTQVTVKSAADSSYRVSQRRSDPEFVASNLKAGDYLIWANGVGQMSVSLPAVNGQRVVFKPLAFNAFLVVRRRGETAAFPPLMEGDLVVEIDGQSLENFAERMNFLKGSLARESTTWTIIRQGIRQRVTFDGREYSKRPMPLEAARAE